MNKMKMTLIIISAFAAFSLALSGCGTSTAADTNTGIDSTANRTFVRDVRIAHATSGDVEKIVSRVSTVRAPEEVELLPQISGQLNELLIEEGSHVRAGQTVARIDNELLVIALERAESILEKRIYDYELSLKELEGGIAGQEKVKQALFLKEQAEKDVARARVELRKAEIKAPISGVISKRFVTRGDMVFSSTPIATIVDTAKLEADVMIPQNQISDIQVGNPVVIVPGRDEERAGKGIVKRISPVVDINNGTVKVTVSVLDRQVMPGTFVRINIITGILEDVVLIPRDAVVIENAMSVIYKVEDGVANRVPIDVGYARNGMIQVRGDIAAGEKVVVSGHTGLDDMMKVNILDDLNLGDSASSDAHAD